MLKRHMMDGIHWDHDNAFSVYSSAAIVAGTVTLIGIAMLLSGVFVPQNPETQILGFIVG